MKFTRVDPSGGVIRKYISPPVYDDGTYVITRCHPRGEWQAWVLLNLHVHDGTASSGLHGIGNSESYHFAPNTYPTLRAARTACERHREGFGTP